MEKLQQVQDEINTVVKGKEEVVKKVLAAIIAGGHILMEDIPGVGKTTLATSVARTLSLNYKRIQFTPDVLPSDILGFSMLDPVTKEFKFQAGAVFSNLLLADEINRTSPKTQSALLEAMEEQAVTVDGVTRKLPRPFFVIATQNPSGSAGTQLLPESQLDRFMICISMGYPAHQDAIAILKGSSLALIDNIQSVLTQEELAKEIKNVENVFVHDAIYDYIVSLVEETRTNPLFSMGASPRGTIALLKMAKAMARLAGRDYVTAQDVQSVCENVLGHRVTLSTRSKAEGLTMKNAMEEIFRKVKSPRT